MKRRPSSDLPDADDILKICRALRRPVRLDALLRASGLARQDKELLESLLERLCADGRLERLRGGRWVVPSALKRVRGRYMALRDGAGGFVTPLDDHGHARGQDLFIPAFQAGDAWHGDLVAVDVSPGAPRAGRCREGRVVAVEERAVTEIPAHVAAVAGGSLLCIPADTRLAFRLDVPIPDGADVPKEGDFLLLAPGERLAADLWGGTILSRLGDRDDVRVQEDAVRFRHDAPRDFPPRVLEEAAALSLREEDLAGREDARSWTLVTIDGADARDFDDAVEVLPRAGGGWLLRVAIADVSHYVRPRSALDREAAERGNSWYFPTSVNPMLPPALCDDLCSLAPGRDRLAMLVEMPVSAGGEPGAPRFVPIVMRSAARLTYDEVRDCLIDARPEALAAMEARPRGAAVLAMLREAFALSAVLWRRAEKRGASDFDLPEPRYDVGPDGRLLSVGRRERHDAHRLIEIFMIAANEAVARHLSRRRTADGPRGGIPAPVLYRVHPHPDGDRLRDLFLTLNAMGLSARSPHARDLDAGDMRRVLRESRGTPQDGLVARLCVRAMPQARYDPENIGHFGLGSDAYCHFTSPIRRYADLSVHRVLKHVMGLDAGPLPAGRKLLFLADQLNRRERASVEAERETARRMACLALRGREGEVLRGVVSGVSDLGVFVELDEMPAEGFILRRDFSAGRERAARRKAPRRGAARPGDGGAGEGVLLGRELEVRLVEADPDQLRLRFVPVSPESLPPLPERTHRERPGGGPSRRRHGDGPDGGGRHSRDGRAGGRNARHRDDGQDGRRGRNGRNDRNGGSGRDDRKDRRDGGRMSRRKPGRPPSRRGGPVSGPRGRKGRGA